MIPTHLPVPASLQGFAATVADTRPISDAVRLLRDLKRARHFVALSWLSEQVLRVQDDPATIHLHAQALVELGLLSAAEEFLNAWSKKTQSVPLVVSVDLAALRGRIAKQRAIEGRNRRRPDWGRHLDDALRAYTSAAEIAGNDPTLAHFPQINILSLQGMAERIKYKHVTPVDRATLESTLISNLDAVPASDPWGLMSRIELALARGDDAAFEAGLQQAMTRMKPDAARADYDAFMTRVSEFVDVVPDFDPYEIDLFTFGSLHRQLTEICGIDDATVTVPVARSVARLRTHILRRAGGNLSLDPRSIGPSQLSPSRFERVFGSEAPLEIKWLGHGILCAQSVASIGVLRGEIYTRQGTGFLLRVLDSAGQPIPNMLLTNAHVVCNSFIRDSKEIWEKTLRPELRVRLETKSLEQQYRVVDSIWVSLPDRHDAALLRIEDAARTEPLRGTANEISAGASSRVVIIGHPNGSNLHISLSDNEVLGTEYNRKSATDQTKPIRLHYRCPTDHGSSGSPVFDKKWNVIALHHAGYSGHRAPLIDETVPPYSDANEGVTIASINEALIAETGGRYRIDLGETP